ncbi:uncharacterized protein BYT42DRAFT_579848 [Radiomyces spectabilis]|uniref:uncharacterized protein n=1 Tax=Radiomyces spectabilis TaxID=64574 RepID=UPI00221F6DAC|nr:uncharacterized protein BYT42DRAFT_579848 [Radiomyces spectabilis]KAI8371330.1 hypothetical protein BYT42DRAFT_579848 [Radiomyces spectabilis]
MGAQASKQAVRRLPKTAKAETLESAPLESPSTIRAQVEAEAEALAAERKTEAIQEESRDPQLHKLLTELGPVKIEPTMTKMRMSDAMLGIIHERKRLEEAESVPSSALENRVSIDELFTILEHRKRLDPGTLDQPGALEALGKKYKMDTPTLETLYKYYNTMAVMPAATDDKDERRLGVWVNSKAEWKQAVNDTLSRQKEAARKAKEAALKEEMMAPPTTNAITEEKKDETEQQKKERELKELFSD